MDSKSKIVHGKDSAAGIAKLLHDLQYKVWSPNTLTSWEPTIEISMILVSLHFPESQGEE
jgi:hypothetical protein